MQGMYDLIKQNSQGIICINQKRTFIPCLSPWPCLAIQYAVYGLDRVNVSILKGDKSHSITFLSHMGIWILQSGSSLKNPNHECSSICAIELHNIWQNIVPQRTERISDKTMQLWCWEYQVKGLYTLLREFCWLDVCCILVLSYMCVTLNEADGVHGTSKVW